MDEDAEAWAHAKLIVDNVKRGAKKLGPRRSWEYMRAMVAKFIWEERGATRGAKAACDEAWRCAGVLADHACLCPTVSEDPSTEIAKAALKAVRYRVAKERVHGNRMEVLTKSSEADEWAADDALARLWRPEVIEILNLHHVDVKVVDGGNGPALRMAARGVDLHGALQALLQLPQLRQDAPGVNTFVRDLQRKQHARKLKSALET